MTLIAVVLGWTTGYLNLSTYEYSYPRPKPGSIKRNIGENFWESSCSQFLKSDFFLICLKIELKQKKCKGSFDSQCWSQEFLSSGLPFVYEQTVQKEMRCHFRNAIWSYFFTAGFFFHLYGITCSKVPANIYFHYSIHFQNLVILWNISISTSHLLDNTLSLSSRHNSVKFFSMLLLFYLRQDLTVYPRLVSNSWLAASASGVLRLQ